MSELPRPADETWEDLDELTQPGREDDLRSLLAFLHPADVADFVGDADTAKAERVLKSLDSEKAAEIVSELDPDDQERILRVLKPRELSSIVGEMASDDMADLLQELDETTANQVLATLPDGDREDVEQLLNYPPDSAGGIMQTELVSVPMNSNLGTTIEAVRQKARDIHIISVFVVDDVGRYAGHIALQDLVLNPPTTPIEQVVDPKVVEINTGLDQEEVARIFDRYSLVEIGVVDDDGKLVGRITADDVHEVLVEEAEEDMLKMAGAGGDVGVLESGGVLTVVWKRLPWLVATLVAMLIAARILEAARDVVFDRAVILLVFIPLITGMSGNVGTQSAMITIQSMHDSQHHSVGKIILKDTLVCLVIAILIGLGTVAAVSIQHRSFQLGVCIGIGLACSMVTAGILGSIEPPVLKRLGIDPALAAGPLITAINDISGVVIYTLVSIIFLDQLNLGQTL